MQRTFSYLVLLSTLAACAETSPTDMPARQATIQAMDAAPAVYRYEGTVLIATQDPSADLRLIIGLPTVPQQSVLCGGSETFDMASYQESGIDRDAIQALARSGDINVHVYRRSTYAGVCRTTPLAQGTGQLVYTDNDLYGSENPRRNSFGFSLHANVTLAAGGDATVHAENRFVVNSDGTFNMVVNFIELR